MAVSDVLGKAKKAKFTCSQSINRTIIVYNRELAKKYIRYGLGNLYELNIIASKTLWTSPYTVGNDWLKLQISVFGMFGVWTVAAGPLRTSAEVKARLVHLFQISYLMAVLS